jgi:hypothetical protein
MYEEILPPIRSAATQYWEEILRTSWLYPRYKYIDVLSKGADDLEHISAMAGRRDYQLARSLHAKVSEHRAQWTDRSNWQDTRSETGDDIRTWIGNADRLRALVEGIHNDAATLEARLRKRID